MGKDSNNVGEFCSSILEELAQLAVHVKTDDSAVIKVNEDVISFSVFFQTQSS